METPASQGGTTPPDLLANKLGVSSYALHPEQLLDDVKGAINTWGTAGPHAVVEGLRNLWQGNYAHGTHQVVTGGLTTAAPMLAPEAVGMLVAAPVPTLVGGGAMTLAGQEAPKFARAVGATPDQADVVGDVAALGTGVVAAKLISPALSSLSRWSQNRSAASMGEAYTQSTRDVQAALNVNADDVHRARPFLEAVHANPTGIPIVGKDSAGQQFYAAASSAVDEIEDHIRGVIQQFPQVQVPAASRRVLTRVQAMPGVSPADLAAAQQEIARWNLDQPRSLADAESLRQRLNAENRSILEGSGVRQRTALQTNPAYVARQQAAHQLRDDVYGALEQQGVQGIRELRQSEGSLLTLRDAADPITRGLRGEAPVARTGQTSLPRRLLQRAAPVLGAGVGGKVGGPPGAMVGAEVGREATAGLTTKNLSKNELLERSFRQRFTDPPVLSTQVVREPVTPGTVAQRIDQALQAPPGPPRLLASHTSATPPAGPSMPGEPPAPPFGLRKDQMPPVDPTLEALGRSQQPPPALGSQADVPNNPRARQLERDRRAATGQPIPDWLQDPETF